ncbi:hypothetical protein [Rubinisphaera italica]|uniref:SWIM-type domain-containing protein n=1 Tax=Rubinisphaera italica TaxID=2527969 RepID=A0A5C5XP65_9PLAN|nr:hypothetical protein [Rubinisphaera italica]TWT63845.1 hypothetical protein Pan54_46040 [Rubinisphaera italica]
MTIKLKVSSRLLSELIESAPNRVRRRLDREPDAAKDWSLQQLEDRWIVSVSEETITLHDEVITSLDQIHCTCLLAPNCFHILAMLTQLEVSIENTSSENEATEAPVGEESNDDAITVTAEQQVAIQEFQRALAQLMQVGISNTGVVIQSGLLRAIHRCRAERLYRLAAIGLQIATEIHQFRSRSVESNPEKMAEDYSHALEVIHHLLHDDPPSSIWVGTSRRTQFPIRPRKLHGLLAEPIITASGYAGAVAYFLGEDDGIYSAADVRPGDAQFARAAYAGGIEIGPLIQPARQLARNRFIGSEMTASENGRLGRGKSIKLAQQGASSWDEPMIKARFERSIADQLNAIYPLAELPDDARPAGWDFVFLTGVVLGASGPDLLFALTDYEGKDRHQEIRLAIQNENEALQFRENLRMLSCAPGLILRVIARFNLLDPTIMCPLAISALNVNDYPSREEPQLNLPDSWDHRVFLGFDELQPNHLLKSQARPYLIAKHMEVHENDELAALRRRWTALLLAGTVTNSTNKTLVVTEARRLERAGFSTAASLLLNLQSMVSEKEPNSLQKFLAISLYLRACRFALAKSKLETTSH